MRVTATDGRDAAPAAADDAEAADDAGHPIDEAARGLRHRAEIAEDRRDRAEPVASQHVTGQADHVGDEVSARANIAEADRLAEVGQAMDGIVQQGNLMA